MAVLPLVSPSAAPRGCRFALSQSLCYNKVPPVSATLYTPDLGGASERSFVV